MKHTTREAWLEAAVTICTPLFESAGYKVPRVRVACGWPSSGGLGQKRKVLGECWSKDSTTDKVAQIFISPFLVQPDNAHLGVLPTLVHEVVHAVVGHKEKHNKVFGKCARAVGLEGKLTSTHAGAKLVADCEAWMHKLGEYPHARLDATKSPVKKQTTRLIKCECAKCGYTVRTTRKWLDEVGPPRCGDEAHGKMEADNV